MKLDTETLRELIREAIREQEEAGQTQRALTSAGQMSSQALKVSLKNSIDELPDTVEADEIKILDAMIRQLFSLASEGDLKKGKGPSAIRQAFGILGKGIPASEEPVKEGCGMPHTPMMSGMDDDDHEVEMAISDLHKLEEYAPKVSQLAGQYSNLPGWVQAKITLAADYLGKVYHYLDGKHKQGM